MNQIRAGKWLAGRVVASVMAAALVSSACSRDDQLTGPTPKPEIRAAVETAIEVSSLTAPVGQRVAVAVRTSADFVIGGLQGVLWFDPAKLKYVGQVADRANQSVVAEGRRALSIVSLNIGPTGLPPRTVVVAFDVIGGDYTSGLRYELLAAGSRDNGINVEKGRFAGVIAASDLGAGEVRKLSPADWKETIDAVAFGNEKGPLLNPGELRNGNIYGDMNFNGTVTVFDVIDVQNVAAASVAPAVQLLNGTDVTDRDMVLAANVAPANLPGYGESTDGLPPGVAGSGSSTNIDSRVINVFDAIDVQNGAAILCSAADPTFNNFISCHAIPGRDAIAFATDSATVACPLVANAATPGVRRFKRDTVYILPTLAGNVPCRVGSNDDASDTTNLIIDAGTRIVGDSNAALLVGRAGRIFANGTLAQPIVMRCRRATCNPGAWGGLVINGNAQVNNNNGSTSPAIGTRQTGGSNQATAEGFSGNYGGSNNTDNSGVVRFVIIEGAGSRFSGTNERNGLTMNGVGSGTTVDYVQSVGGLDDGFEWFGGTVNASHLYSDNNQDDNFDWVGGATFSLQFGISRGCNTGCDNGIEGDNFGVDGGGTDPEASPRSNPTVANLTLVGSQTPATPTTGFHGMLLRQNTAATIRNLLVVDFKAGLDIDSVGWSGATAPPNSPGIVMQNLCTNLLSIRNSILAGSWTAQPDSTHTGGAFVAINSNGDRDSLDGRFADRSPTNPAFGCAPTAPHPTAVSSLGYFHLAGGADSLNVEYMYIREPVNNLTDDITRAVGGAGNYYMVAPYAVVPDYRPQASRAGDVGLRSGTTGCAIDPTTLGAFFKAAPYCGAVEPVGAVANIPWYAGWTNPR